jgi:hypothetical protein
MMRRVAAMPRAAVALCFLFPIATRPLMLPSIGRVTRLRRTSILLSGLVVHSEIGAFFLSCLCVLRRVPLSLFQRSGLFVPFFTIFNFPSPARVLIAKRQLQDASLSVSNTEGAALVDNVTQRLHDVLGHVLVHGADSLADLLFHLTHAILLPFLHIFDGLLSEALHCCSRCCSALRDLILQKCRSVLMHLVELFHALLLIVNDPPLNILKALLCRFQVVLVQQVKIAASTKVGRAIL